MSRGDDDYNISASQVKAHASCPKQWEYKYRSDKEPTKDNTEYLRLGSRVHESIEEALTAEMPPPLDHKEALKSAFQNIYAEKDEIPVPNDMYDDGLKYLAKAAKVISDRDPDIRDIEKRVEYQISNDRFTSGATAIMDVVTETGIWDWKTGSIRDETPHEEKIQGSVYMAAYYDEYGEPPEEIIFFYLKEGKKRSIDPGDEIWEYMIKRAEKLVRAKEENNFPAKPGDQCYWCGYEYWCSAASVGMGDVPYDEY